MQPILFTIGDLAISSHGFFFLAGLLAGLLVLQHEARRRRWTKNEVVPITLAATAGGFIGARLSLLLFHGIETAPVVLDFFRLFDPRIGPGSILGAVAGAYIGGAIAGRAIGQSGCACDAFAPAMALAMAVGRIGDFLSGEDGLGQPTTLPWGVRLPGADAPVHPAPLYDAGFDLIWFGVLILLRDHPRLQGGNLLKFGLAGYAIFRFFIEFVRNNRVLAFGLTGQQYFCVALLAVLGLYVARGRRLGRLSISAQA